jgi:hypothetical protein
MQRPTYRYGITILKNTAFLILLTGVFTGFMFLNSGTTITVPAISEGITYTKEIKSYTNLWTGLGILLSSLATFGFFITLCSIAESLLFIAHKKN